MLAAIEPVFASVLGFDLTLPVLLAARRLLNGQGPGYRASPLHERSRSDQLHPSRQPVVGRAIDLAAMDAFDTAFARRSVDCVVTSFLIDLLPDPRRLAREIHRMLRSDGVWINYGPSGPLKALWRFDGGKASGFVEGFGFTVDRVGGLPRDLPRPQSRLSNLELSESRLLSDVCAQEWEQSSLTKRPGLASRRRSSSEQPFPSICRAPS